MNAFNLREHELTVEEVHRNLAPSALYEHAILYEKDAHIAENGALVAHSGVKTGRSPKDKRVVKQEPSGNEVWWGRVNIPLASQAFAINRERARDYLNSQASLLFRRLRRLGYQISHEGSRHMLTTLSRALSCIRC